MSNPQRQKLVDELADTWKLIPSKRFGELFVGIGERAGYYTEAFRSSDESLFDLNLDYRASISSPSAKGKLTSAALSLLKLIRGLIVEYPGTQLGRLIWNILAWTRQGDPLLIHSVDDDDMIFGATSMMKYRVSPKAKRKLPRNATIDSPEDTPGVVDPNNVGALTFMFEVYVRRRFAFLEEAYAFIPSLKPSQTWHEHVIEYSRGALSIDIVVIPQRLEWVDVNEKTANGVRSTSLVNFVKKRLLAKVASKRGVDMTNTCQSGDWYAGVLRTHIDAIISECGL